MKRKLKINIDGISPLNDTLNDSKLSLKQDYTQEQGSECKS